MNMNSADFTTVTEVPGILASRRELSQMYTRYHWASKFVLGKRVLELACGSGPGLGFFLSEGASRVMGSDIEERNLRHARQHYAGRPGLEFQIIDAHAIPVPDASFDVVVIFEAIYYLATPSAFFREAFRVLAPGGKLLVATVNREWPQFNPSPFSLWYPSARELSEALKAVGFEVVVKGGFPDERGSLISRFVAVVRRMAIRLHLIPRTMKGKELFKRIFYGRLKPIPAELKVGAYELEPLVAVDLNQADTLHVFLYAEATRG
jgi:SAM-dependent methyltransferase